MRVIALFGLLALSACVPFGGFVTLPNDATIGGGDPDRAAIMVTSHAFSAPGVLAGRPRDAARAAANLEYLAASLPTDPRWTAMSPTVGLSLRRGRDEMRTVLGITGDAPAQPVIDRLFAASRALDASDPRAAEGTLNVAPFTAGGAVTLRRLAALPDLPQANRAAVMAAAEMWRIDTEGRDTGGGGGGSGGAHP